MSRATAPPCPSVTLLPASVRVLSFMSFRSTSLLSSKTLRRAPRAAHTLARVVMAALITAGAVCTGWGQVAPIHGAGSEGRNVESHPVSVERTVVTDTAVDEIGEAELKLAEVVGGVALIRTDELERGRVSNTADALRNQAGVFAQASDGGEATKISIRGSGLVRTAINFNGGIQVLLDGEPISSLSGIPYESNEPLAASRIEVYRGANAFEYGPLSLGGTINYITKTGREGSPFNLRFEAGSFGYFRGQASTGLVAGPLDLYASVTRFEQEGDRRGSEGNSTRYLLNAGYALTPQISNRLHVRYVEQYQQVPGFLTWSQLRDDPRRSQFTNIRERINRGSTTISDNLAIQIAPDTHVEFSAQYKDYPVHNSLGSPAPILWSFSDVSATVRLRHEGTLFNRPSRSTVALTGMKQLTAEAYGLDGANRNIYLTDYDALDVVLVASNDLNLGYRWWLTTGVAAARQDREVQLVYPFTEKLSDAYVNVLPRLGVRYEHSKDVQFFANVSGSVEAPTTLSYTRNNAANIPFTFVDVDDQVATTAEIGTRGSRGRWHWDVSYYHAWVRDGLLIVVIDQNLGTTATANGAPTRHQGLEAAVDVDLWTDASSDVENNRGSRVYFRQVFTWSDFFFAGNSDRKLPGVPSLLYQGDLGYEHRSGFFAGLTLESSLERYPVDFANSINTPKYVVYGARAGFAEPGGRWDVFVEVRNLSDERYAASVSPIYDALGNKERPVYSPGLGRNVSFGASFHF